MAFTMKINLGNVEPTQDIKKELVSGVYRCEITKMEGKTPIYEDSEVVGYKRGLWIFKVADGDYSGSTFIHSMNTPKDSNDWIAKLWLDSLLSCGYDMEEIADMASYDDEVYVGRECFMQYTEKKENGGTYDKARFLKSEEDYTTLKERGVSSVSKAKKGFEDKKPSSPKINVDKPKINADLNALISGIGEMPF